MLRHSSGRVSHQDRHHQGWNRKVRENTRERAAWNCKSVVEAGLIAGGQGGVEGRQASSQLWTFWMNQNKIRHVMEGNHDWCRIEASGTCTKAQKIGLIWQSFPNAIVFNDPLPADCLVEVVNRRRRAI